MKQQDSLRPGSNRAILLAGLLLCILGAVALAYFLGMLDWIGVLG